MEPYIGEIRLAGFGFAPRGWMLCQGQTIAISQNQALYSLLGVTYGGDGIQTFKLPDLRGRIAVGTGRSWASSATYVAGQVGGTEGVALNPQQLPTHQHSLTGTLHTTGAPDNTSPLGNYMSKSENNQFGIGTANTTMAAGAVQGTTDNAGGSQPHENRQPFIAMNYMIAVQGVFPSRN
ncbi:phage tail protein [Hymenobacter busanensis]|uniref:Phage tail protein n=1 Tax=Hymenobacter busanensis TaxID=2607656 RepID=A0A7L4ZYR1_9BACT|nr:tail fiber protein [Hymenobacter busanensis]KAA9333345.1 phage tail protein [Hymenobacter busanensis]QHJ07976.1 phage tail protein [Hymenobacter busanensis]